MQTLHDNVSNNGQIVPCLLPKIYMVTRKNLLNKNAILEQSVYMSFKGGHFLRKKNVRHVILSQQFLVVMTF